MSFQSLGLSRSTAEVLSALQITEPTPIQRQAIPPALSGRDVVGLAQTGTGKTAAFALPIIERLADGGRPAPMKVRALVLSPTRELAQQIAKSVRDFGRKTRLRSGVVVGGVSIRPQIKMIAQGVDVLIATPGRLEDLVRQKAVELDQTAIVVLDEADQMMDIGFMPAIRRILSLMPAKRQTMLFSATMPKEIRELAARYLKEPVEVSVAPAARTADRIDQSVMHLPARAKMAALAGLIREKGGERVIVFTRTKRGADKAAKRLETDGIASAAIHGNKSQGQRDRALAGFRAGTVPVLIATDIAARGIDVPGVGLVVNFELPNVPEVYVHRIGRTARAGAAGEAVTLCAPDERALLRDIERLIKLPIPVVKAPEGTFDDALAGEDAFQADAGGERLPVERRGPANGRRDGEGRGQKAGGRPRGAKPGGQKAQGHRKAGRPETHANGGDGRAAREVQGHGGESRPARTAPAPKGANGPRNGRKRRPQRNRFRGEAGPAKAAGF